MTTRNMGAHEIAERCKRDRITCISFDGIHYTPLSDRDLANVRSNPERMRGKRVDDYCMQDIIPRYRAIPLQQIPGSPETP